jgi:hypothetical protein
MDDMDAMDAMDIIRSLSMSSIPSLSSIPGRASQRATQTPERNSFLVEPSAASDMI